ncbi:RNA-directed DNA polymerase, eukaryota, partial [Tanacetum coccineum]
PRNAPHQITLEEIKEAVWDCGSSKAPLGITWMVTFWFVRSFGFGNKWCSWIKACLNSSRASILINGSPTSEFSIKRGLRQGDPLSPFLFILVMEGLHNAFEEAVGNGLITGVNIKNSTINVSHLFYADDVIITTDWNAKDMDNIIRVLHSIASGRSLSDRIHMEAFPLGKGYLLSIGGVDFIKSSKLIMVKKEVSIQMVVASRAFGLTLLEPPIFFTRKVSVKQKPIYRPKPTGEVSPKTDPPANMKKVSIRGNSSIKTLQTNVSTSSNGTFSLSNTFEVLNADNSVAEDVDSGDRIVMSSVQEERQSSTPFVEKINLVEQQLLERKCVLLDHEGKPVKRIDYTSDHDSDDEVESVDNDMARFLASNPSGVVGYGTNSLLEQWRETYGDVDHEYDPYDDDLYKGQEVSEKIQSICDNLDIKIRGRKKK